MVGVLCILEFLIYMLLRIFLFVLNIKEKIFYGKKCRLNYNYIIYLIFICMLKWK